MKQHRMHGALDGLAPLVAGSRSFAALTVFLYAFTVPFQRAFQFGAIGSPATVAGGLALVSGIAAVALTGRRQPLSPALLAGLSLPVLVVLSLAWSPYPRLMMEPGLRALAPATAQTVLQLAVVLWLVWEFIDDRRALQRLMAAYVFGSIVAATIAIRAWRTAGGDQLRITGGDAILANPQAFTLAIGVPLAWHVFIQSRNPFVRLPMLAYVPIGALAVFLTGSRTGAFGLLVGLAIVPLTLRTLPTFWRSLTIAALVITIPLVPSLVPDDTLSRAFSSDDVVDTSSDVELRSSLRAVGIEAFLDFPLGGGGGGIVRERVADQHFGYDTRSSSHNSPINVAAEYGIFALALFVVLVLSTLGAVRANAGIDRTLAALLCVVLIVVVQFVNLEFHKTTWIVVSLLLVHARNGRHEQAATSAREPQPSGAASADQSALAPVT